MRGFIHQQSTFAGHSGRPASFETRPNFDTNRPSKAPHITQTGPWMERPAAWCATAVSSVLNASQTLRLCFTRSSKRPKVSLTCLRVLRREAAGCWLSRAKAGFHVEQTSDELFAILSPNYEGPTPNYLAGTWGLRLGPRSRSPPGAPSTVLQ